MKWFDRWIQRCYNRARARDEEQDIMPVETLRKGRGSTGHTLSANKRVASTYDDEQVLNFTIYGASGGRIVEIVRYDDKKGSEKVHRHVISDDADLAESLSKIVTLEYLR